VTATLDPTPHPDDPTASSRPPIATSIELRVRYSETDQMGVVYHAHYFVWCEIARTELIRERFAPYAELERQGILLAVADASIRYHAAARYDDLIRVEVWVEEVRSRTITFGYKIGRIDENGDGERLATARITLIAIGRDARPRKLPTQVIGALSRG
jgi:acyl-CoA thioester hydrolase